jgi:sensor domain CHASE-containing protein
MQIPPANYRPSKASLCLLGAISGFGCACLGLMVMAGWLFHIQGLVQTRTEPSPVQFNTGLCFLLAGIGLGISSSRRRASMGLGAASGVIALLSLSEYWPGSRLGIDQLFFHSAEQSILAGRISIICAICFLIMAIGLVSLCLRGQLAGEFGPSVAGMAGSVLLSINLVSLIGYGLGLPGTPHFTHVPVYAALGFFLYGFGLIAIAWEAGRSQGEFAPRWLPAPLALGVFSAAFILFLALASKQDESVAQSVRADALGVKSQMETRMDARSRSLARTALNWEISGAPTREQWQANAASVMRDLPDIALMAWLDQSGRTQWVWPATTTASTGLPQNSQNSTEALDRQEKDKQPVITGVVTLPNGARGFAIYTPVTIHGVLHGFLMQELDAKICMDRYLPTGVANGEAIQMSEGGHPFYQRDTGEAPAKESWTVTERIPLHGATWEVRMWPTRKLAEQLNSALPEVVLWAGIIGGLLLAAVSFYAQLAVSEATETERANAALREALQKVKTLEGLLPVCCTCKRVRDESGYWSQIDTYLRRHTKAAVSHSYCPECAAKFYEDCGIEVPEKVKLDLEARNFE